MTGETKEYPFTSASGNRARWECRAAGDRQHYLVLWKNPPSASDLKEFDVWWAANNPQAHILRSKAQSAREARIEGAMWLERKDN